MGYDGGVENCPSARFGNLSINNAILRHPIYGLTESFVVEMRSISGYSGSPVFIYWDFMSVTKGNRLRSPDGFSTFFALLGIDWGHIPYKTILRMHDGRVHPDGSYVNGHTAMSGVVPAWYLENFLETPRFLAQRKADDSVMIATQSKDSLPIMDYPGGD
jgi:hypothetical protein